jgi:hypothetical protein
MNRFLILLIMPLLVINVYSQKKLDKYDREKIRTDKIANAPILNNIFIIDNSRGVFDAIAKEYVCGESAGRVLFTTKKEIFFLDSNGNIIIETKYDEVDKDMDGNKRFWNNKKRNYVRIHFETDNSFIEYSEFDKDANIIKSKYYDIDLEKTETEYMRLKRKGIIK